MENSSQDLPEDLRDGCLRQDPGSQKKLYKKFYGLAMAICLRYAQNREEAVDIMNEGFYKVLIRFDKYDFNKPFKPWLSKVMTNTAIDHYRSSIRHSIHQVEITEINDSGIEASVYSKLNYEELLKLVQQLPNGYRTVFNLFAIDGYTHEEIGKILGISIGTSKSNLFKARQKLKEFLLQGNNHFNNKPEKGNNDINTDEEITSRSYGSVFQGSSGISGPEL
ncbi:RNA polymerase sigma factor [Daejeonella oryzae]|uniref:RNA polymerase sigma factor n=1 Tax=Daejeonella oryzae TaxID=1122943 RepID=UPI0009DB819D|nr:sigma-70 family RNA polymerase sigma factor [Daejeonella oryzae]